MSPDAESVRVRGTPVKSLCSFVSRELDVAALACVLEKLPAPWSRSFGDGSLLASDRVPLSVVNLFTESAAEAKGEPVDAFAERAGTFGAREGTSTVFKPFFFILSVSNALQIAPLMWSRVYDAGKMRVESEAKSASIRVTEFPGSLAGCARITGWFRYIGELSGARNIRSRHDLCTSKGSAECVWKLSWE